MFSTSVVLYLAFQASVVAQSSTTASVICIAGQCVQGFSNTTIGAKIAASGSTALQLLPGQYTSTTNPQLLHNLLTSSSSKLSPSPGFENASLASLPLNLELAPGAALFSERLYAGQSTFSALPSTPASNGSSLTSLAAGSVAVSSNVWVAVSSNASSNQRVVLWDSVPDFAQLPSSVTSRSLAILDIQSSTCSPPCSGNGVCSASGTCSCPTGFTGSSCESCAAGFFGSKCQPCPDGCSKCDEGINGTGRCLVPTVKDAPSTCNCENGKCGSNGQCTCNPGWTTGDDGKSCAKCATGFFQTSGGDCQVCQLGCTQCADTSGTCIACKTGFTQNANDKSKCNPVSTITTSNTVCPDGSFSTGAQCATCSPTCRTCNGGTSNDCTLCAIGTYLFNGNCVAADTNGICQGTNGMIADNNKNECDTCPSKCTSCKIPSFSTASTVNQLQCTGCLPGSVLSQGKCVQSCPAGTFVSPTDNFTCTPCSSSCATCAGNANFCLTCTSNLLASPTGQCVSTCPPSSFPSTAASGSCLTCHPDCTSCSGSSFNQCTTCPPSRPVLSNGRCLPTCSKKQFFDTTSSQCKDCNSACGSCSGPGDGDCLACDTSKVLKGGSCVDANCGQGAATLPGLGVCLSSLVIVPGTTGTSPTPLPTITGLADPTIISGKKRLEWWEILLMALGCAFIFVVIVWLWRRRAKKQRKERTKEFAKAKKLDGKGWRRFRFGFGWLWGRNKKPKDVNAELPVAYNHHERSSVIGSVKSWGRETAYTQDFKMKNITPSPQPPPKHLERSNSSSSPGSEPRHPHDEAYKRETVDDLISAYNYSTHSPSALPSLNERRKDEYTARLKARVDADNLERSNSRHTHSHSLFEEVTGQRRNTPEPRQPVRSSPMSFSGGSSLRTSTIHVPALEKGLKLKQQQKDSVKEGRLVDFDQQSVRDMTDAQRYMLANKPILSPPPPQLTRTEQSLPQFHPIPTYASSSRLHPNLTGTTMTSRVPPPPFIDTSLNMNLTGGSFMPIPVTLNSNSTSGTPTGTYWLTPVPTGLSAQQQQQLQLQMQQGQLQTQPYQMQIQPQQQPQMQIYSTPAEDTVVLQPMMTGASNTSNGSSRNPFRKGSY
ncbi:hypothetical protein CPB83DRAFT_890095 [Crepidotus variabilis]|uniref:EGF-like domain-containing protein n=1 Tax=Crepidotus variabilis TaxID=179855 RepID=A0A9P6ERI3_9AGAR|nr:hypothetical protein CPB83DRAFT_890095 [Crepidotus variabilis]